MESVVCTASAGAPATPDHRTACAGTAREQGTGAGGEREPRAALPAAGAAAVPPRCPVACKAAAPRCRRGQAVLYPHQADNTKLFLPRPLTSALRRGCASSGEPPAAGRTEGWGGLGVCVCIYIYTDTYICTYTYVNTDLYLRTYIYIYAYNLPIPIPTYRHMPVYLLRCVHKHEHTHVLNSTLYTHVYKNIQMCIYIHTHIDIAVPIYQYLFMYAYIKMKMHTHTSKNDNSMYIDMCLHTYIYV